MGEILASGPAHEIFLDVETLVSLLDEGTDLVIGHGCEFIDAFLELAPACPSSYFFAMDRVDEGEDWPENYACLYQRQYEAAYLCGRSAAHMTASGRVGFIGGMEVPTQVANCRAFEAGAQSLESSIEVLAEYAGTFEDPHKGRQMALEMFHHGVDFLMHTASETGNGVLKACVEHRVRTVGFILDQSKLAPECIVTSLLVDVARIYQRKVREVISHEFRPGVWAVGLAEDFVGLAPFSPSVPLRVAEDIRRTREKIISGAVTL
jgi:basic membrane protein A